VNITVVNHEQTSLSLLIFLFAIYVRDAGTVRFNTATASESRQAGKVSRADNERSDRSIVVYSRASSEPAEARVVVGVARQSPGCLSQRRGGR